MEKSCIPQLFEYLMEVISNADWRSLFLSTNRKYELFSVWQNAILNIWVCFHGDRDLTGVFISFLLLSFVIFKITMHLNHIRRELFKKGRFLHVGKKLWKSWSQQWVQWKWHLPIVLLKCAHVLSKMFFNYKVIFFLSGEKTKWPQITMMDESRCYLLD